MMNNFNNSVQNATKHFIDSTVILIQSRENSNGYHMVGIVNDVNTSG